MPHVDKNYKPTRGDRIILALLSAFKRKRKPKKIETTRTKVISDRLKEAGISQKGIDRIRNQKKSKYYK